MIQEVSINTQRLRNILHHTTLKINQPKIENG
jgi:hypothetical protein